MPSKVGALPSIKKWMGLVAAIWIQAFAGSGSMFPDYSSTLKTVLHYNQLQLNVLAVMKDFGGSVGILAGIVCNKIPPWAMVSIGSIIACLGYIVLWLVASQRIDGLAYWQMCIALFISSNSTTWFTTAVLVTCMRNFPRTRGTVAGLLKGFVGLCAAIFTQIFTAFLGKDPAKLLLFLATGPPVVCLICMGSIRASKTVGFFLDEPEEQSNFFFINVLCIALAVYLLFATLVEDLVPINNSIALKVLASVTFLFLLAHVFLPIRLLINRTLAASKSTAAGPVAVSIDSTRQPLIDQEISTDLPMPRIEEENQGGWPAAAGFPTQDGEVAETLNGRLAQERKMSSQSLTPESSMSQLLETDEIDIDIDELTAVAEGAILRKRKPRRGEDFKLKQALVKADFWLLFATFFFGVGSAITAFDNLAQIGEAQGYADVSFFVSLVSITNFLGRLGGGWVSEYYVRLAAVPRTVWMAGAQACMIAGHLLLSVAISGSLYAASVILGFGYGVQFSIMVSTASELFGLKHFGIIYNVIAISDPLASALFSAMLAGYLYDREAAKGSKVTSFSQYIWEATQAMRSTSWEGTPMGSGAVCTGAHCFRLTFQIMAGLCVIGTALSLVLSYRIWPVYKTLYDPNNRSYPTLPPAQQSINQDSH